MSDAPPTAGVLDGPPPARGGTDRLVRLAAWAAAVTVLLVLPPSGLLQRVVIGVAGAAVLWLLWPARTTPKEARWSPLLVGAGLLMLGGWFLFANPYWGAISVDWPWVQWGKANSWVHRADLLLSVLVALLAIAVGAGVGGRRLAPALLVLAAFLASRAQSKSGGAGNYVRIDRLNLAWTLSASALGAGLLRLAGRGATGRGLARLLCLAGALGICAVYAGWFPEDVGQKDFSLNFYAHEFAVMWDRVVLGSELDPDLQRKFVGQIWAVLLPFACQAVAVGVGLVLAVLPTSPERRGRRWLAAVGCLLLLLTWLLAPRAGLWFDRAEYEERTMTKVAEVLGELFVRSGLCVWMVLVGALLRVLGAPVAPGEAPLRPPEPSSLGAGALPPAGRWPYAVAAVLAALVLHACFQPTYGLLAPVWPRQVLAQGRWIWESANLVFQAVFLVFALAAATAPARGVGVGTTLLIVTWLVLAPLSASDQRMYDVETWVPGVAAALSAAGAAAMAVGDGRRRSRFLAVAGALCLLGLLCYPIFVPIPTGPRAPATGPVYQGYLPTEVIRAAFETSDPKDLFQGLLVPWRMGVLLHTALVVAALLAALGVARRGASRAVVALFLAVLAYPVVHALIPGAGGEAFVKSGAEGLAAYEQRFGAAVRKYETPYLLGLFAAVSTLLRPALRSRVPAATAPTAPHDEASASVPA